MGLDVIQRAMVIPTAQRSSPPIRLPATLLLLPPHPSLPLAPCHLPLRPRFWRLQ